MMLIIFSEMSTNYAGKNLTNTFVFFLMPLVLGLLFYLTLRNKLIHKEK